jgi:LysR family transcriptional regulator, flagellar master operon regulator
MDMETLRTFLQVIETKSLVAASKRLHVTQSTVTARLNLLERDVGQRLLHRSKAGAELTSAGFKFKRYAEVLLQTWRQAKDDISPPPGMNGVCNVGLEFDLWRGLGQDWLDHLRKDESGIAVAMWPGEQPQLDRWLNIGLIDVAFVYAPLAGEGHVRRLLFEDDIVLVSTTAAKRPRLDTTYVYVDHGDEFRRQHAAAFPGGTGSAITIASSAWAVDFLLAYGGMGYLPMRHAEPLLRRRRLHRVPDAPSFKRAVYLVANAHSVRDWPWYEQAAAAMCTPARRPPSRRRVGSRVD